MLPLLAGGENTALNVSSPVDTEVIVGAEGTTPGIAETALLEVPPPLTFTARTTTEYEDPLASPVTTSGLVVAAGERVTHDTPPLSEY